MLVGVFVLWSACGQTLDFIPMFDAANKAIDPGRIELGCLLLFCGAVGKSAQFPLHVWLPDAMEGPTPVSALIHAATMVTAGVYLVARCAPLFVVAPLAQPVVSVVGGITGLLAALIALTQHDLKRVLAYSTVSQLGYMFMALGCPGMSMAHIAVTAALFHLFNHAFFKSLLFLSSGSVMHAMGNVIDMRRIGGLRKVMPYTHAAFLVGAISLSAFPLLWGFWSKDLILETLKIASEQQEGVATIYSFVLAVALAAAFCTAFYTFRGYFRTFWGELRIPPEAGEHAHESPRVMTVPLMVLSAGAVVAGFSQELTGWLGNFLGKSFSVTMAARVTKDASVPVPTGIDWSMFTMSGSAALAGFGLAYLFYVARPGLPAKIARGAGDLYQLSLNKFYLDELYNAFIVRPLTALAVVASWVESLVDGLVLVVASLPRALGALLRPVQNGLVQFYALAMMMGLTVFVGFMVFRIAR
jgi:NADH-quinone oxidoreductase subunit L